MAVKAHKMDDGTWGKCTATVRACPKGGNDVHMNFSSIQEMNSYNQEIIDEQGAKAYGFLPTNLKKTKISLPRFEVHSMFGAFAM